MPIVSRERSIATTSTMVVVRPRTRRLGCRRARAADAPGARDGVPARRARGDQARRDGIGTTRLNTLVGHSACRRERRSWRGATAIANLNMAAPLAAEAGITLLVEAINNIDIPGYWASSVATAADLVRRSGATIRTSGCNSTSTTRRWQARMRWTVCRRTCRWSRTSRSPMFQDGTNPEPGPSRSSDFLRRARSPRLRRVCRPRIPSHSSTRRPAWNGCRRWVCVETRKRPRGWGRRACLRSPALPPCATVPGCGPSDPRRDRSRRATAPK